MADFPDSIFTPRTVENRDGVSYDAEKTKVFFAEDTNLPNAEIVAIEETLGLNPEGAATTVGDRLDTIEAEISDLGNDGGWNEIATIPTRQSTDDPIFVLRFAADMTGILTPGMRIRCVQNSATIYLIVHAVGSYSGGNTDVTVYGGTDYDVLDTSTYPISSPYFSREQTPLGFPRRRDKWTVRVTDTTQRNQSSPTTNSYYNLGSISIDVPIGTWEASYQVALGVQNLSNDLTSMASALSTSSSSVSDSDLLAYIKRQADDSGIGFANLHATIFRRKTLTVASKTTYYMIAANLNSNTSYIRFDNEISPLIIELTSVYL